MGIVYQVGMMFWHSGCYMGYACQVEFQAGTLLAIWDMRASLRNWGDKKTLLGICPGGFGMVPMAGLPVPAPTPSLSRLSSA